MDQVWTRLTQIYDEHPAMFVGALVATGFLLRLAVTPFNTPVDVDVFAYMIKAVEIDRGEWTPVRSHAIGWSILLAPGLAMARNLPALTLMNITRVAASAVSALVVVPFAFLVRETLDRRAQVLALLLCPFALLLVRVGVRGFAEPALTLALVGAAAAAVVADRRAGAWAAAAILAGTGFWFHPTGLLNIAIAASIVPATLGRERRLRVAGAVVVLGVVVSAPAAIQRERAFGSAMDFSFNNRFFAASDLEMYTPRAQTPSFRQYLATHSVQPLFEPRFLRSFRQTFRAPHSRHFLQ